MKLGFNEECMCSSDNTHDMFYACVPDPQQPNILAAAWWFARGRSPFTGKIRVGLYRSKLNRAPGSKITVNTFSNTDCLSETVKVIDFEPLLIQLAIFDLIQNYKPGLGGYA